MNLTSLTVWGDEDLLDAIRRILSRDPESEWRRGDIRRNGRVCCLFSGFNIEIADAENPKAAIEAICVFLDDCHSKAVKFDHSKITAELGIGLTVGDSRQFTASYDFTAADLRHMAVLGIGLQISAYPTSDEVN